MNKKETLKIGLLGYYGNDAYCDDYLEYIIKRTFNNIANKNNIEIEWTLFQGTINRRLDGTPINYNIEPLDAIILGGGSILGVDYNIKSLKDNIPFYIYGSGFRDLNSGTLDNLKLTLEKATFISLRGFISVEKLEDLNINTEIQCIGDPIFLYKPKKSISKNPYTIKFISGIFRPYLTNSTTMKEIYNYLQSTRNQKVQLLSFSKSQGDVDGGRSLEFQTVDYLNARKTYNQLISSSFSFGNRLHPFCISLIHGIPTIGLDIEFDKVESVCSSINYPYYLKNNNLNLESFKEKYLSLTKYHLSINRKIQIRIKHIRENLESFAEKIFNDISSRQ